MLSRGRTGASSLASATMQAILRTINRDPPSSNRLPSMWTRLSETNPAQFGLSSYGALARTLQAYDPQATLAQLAGLLTVPKYQPQTIRIEVLIHLAALHCRGRKQPKLREIKRWLEDILGNHDIKSQEDPLEDVFVSNVVGPGGNYRLIEGIWETGDYYVQQLIDCLARTPLRRQTDAVITSVVALLRLSDLVVQRSGLSRWESSPETAPSKHFLDNPRLTELASRVTFTFEELRAAGVPAERLAPFMLQPAERSLIANELLGHSSVERYPVIRFGQRMVLACPTAVSAAIRRYILEVAHDSGWLEELQQYLRLRQGQAFEESVQHLCGTSSPFRGPLPAEAAPANPVHAAFDTGLGAFDSDKLVHFVLLHDDLEEIRHNGLATYAEGPEGLAQYLTAAAGYYGRRAISGLTVLVRGGLGRGLEMEPPMLHPRWNLAVMGIADFEMFAWSKHASLLRLWKLQLFKTQLENQQIEVFAPFGILDLWSFWIRQDFQLVDRRMMLPSSRHQLAHVPSDFMYDFRVHERRRFDHHAVAVPSGSGHTTVERLSPDSFFATRQQRPIYASRELTGHALLAGVVEGRRLSVWVEAERPDASEHIRHLLYQLWDGLLHWVDRILEEVDASLQGELATPLQLRLSFANLDDWEAFHTTAGTIPAEDPVTRVVPEKRRINVFIPYGFTTLVARPTNDAEQILVHKVTSALRDLLVLYEPEAAIDPRAVVERVIPNTAARSIHLFRTWNPLDALYADGKPEPRFVQPEDREFHKLGLGWEALKQPEASEHPHEITEPKGSSQLLNAAVDVLWDRLRNALEELNGPELVRVALTNNEAISQDRSWWSKTASALAGLYADHEDVVRVAAQRESERALAMQSGRILIEMAVPTCKAEGGKLVSTAEFDRLLAAVAALLLIAAESAAIHGGLANATIRIFPNGEIETDQEFAATVAAGYTFENFGGVFRTAVENYTNLYQRDRTKKDDDKADPFDEPTLTAAFKAEYGITPPQLFDVLGELWDWAIEDGTAVIETTRGALADRLVQKRALTTDEANSVLQMLSLVPRERWDSTPDGYSKRDWIPWHFRRRLSVVARPLIAFGETADDTLLFGAEQVGVSISNLLEGVRMAWLPNEFFVSAEMKQLRGTITDRLGNQFAEDVAAKLRVLGWTTLTEVQMTQLGAPQKLGDVDVVAWHASDPQLLLIECKRLQPIRNMGEIVERLNQFKGEADDRLGRHLRRVEWIEKNLPQVRKRLRIGEHVQVLLPLLVTNDEVPMRFTTGLALPPEQVVPWSLIKERVGEPNA